MASAKSQAVAKAGNGGMPRPKAKMLMKETSLYMAYKEGDVCAILFDWCAR